ncbi:MAG: hypothetical protein DWQ10_14560, partial [Calditrichaeota bacterium]
MKIKNMITSSILLMFTFPLAAQHLDLAVNGYGLSLGNSSKITGVRINWSDDRVEKVTGLNMTMWRPTRNPNAEFKGMYLGLVGTDAKSVQGISLTGVGIAAAHSISGVHITGLGLASDKRISGTNFALGIISGDEAVTGINVGSLALLSKNGSMRWINIGGLACVANENLTGLNLGGLATVTGRGTMRGLNLSSMAVVGNGGVRGINLAGLALVSAGGEISGINLSGIATVAGTRLFGLNFGGVATVSNGINAASALACNDLLYRPSAQVFPFLSLSGGPLGLTDRPASVWSA